jgi:hypothetical protein
MNNQPNYRFITLRRDGLAIHLFFNRRDTRNALNRAMEVGARRQLLPLSPRPEQFAMRSRSVKHDSIARDAVDQQPIRVHMALGESREFALESMFPEGVGQRLCRLKQSEDVFERFVVESVTGEFSLQAAEVAFETPREDDLPHRRLRCATASLAVLKRRTLPSRSSRRDCSNARRAAAFSS